MTTLVTGSRGRVGATLVNLLHSKGLGVRAASGTPEQLSPPSGVPTVKCDLGDPSTFAAALDGIESVFLYAQPAHIDAFIAEAESAGVRHIVLLSSSSVLEPPAAEGADSPIAVLHRDVERALEAGPVAATFLRPGAFSGNALRWSHAIRTTGRVDLPYPQSYSDPIHEADIADAAFAVLTEPELRGSAYHLSGPESLSFADQLAVLSGVAGREVKANVLTPDAWKEAVGGFMPAGFADVMLTYWAAQDGKPTVVTDAVERLTGHPGRTFAEWAQDHAEAFRA
ncbi:NmrA family transcriptional regulator [Streptomyces sp. 150FB]|uniref:NAD(P)H-binding protein n=1 Tax=Streptomyces sp. 150FB TaxID=1576605 RepID=UPI00058968DB|nr:NAD(P)H-binding protein [Streptomyces sp. 150FB]KIF76071.1 NmrA family transcriptional regulator [Streptomyces sp. 150FB]